MTRDDGDSSDSVAWVADSGFLIACGRQQNPKYSALERFARRHEITFVIPERVYEELGGAPDRSTPGQTPINSAIEAGWMRVADPLDYTETTVSAVMDRVRGYIARASNRPEDQIEKADTALAGVSVQLLTQTDVDFLTLVTTDTDAGRGVVAALDAHGFEGQVEYRNGFKFIDEMA